MEVSTSLCALASAQPLEVTSMRCQAPAWGRVACGVDSLPARQLLTTPSLFLEQFVCGSFAGGSFPEAGGLAL